MMADRIKIYDTTLRDGSQGFGITFSLEDKLRLTAALDDLGIHYIEGGWPGSNPKDIAFFAEAKKIRFKNARLAAFSSTRRPRVPVEQDANIRQLIASETPVVTVFGKAWEFHVKSALQIELEENLDMISDTIRYLKRYFDEVIFDAEHFFDGYKDNPEFALKVLAVSHEAGSDWIVLCDTNGGTLPFECEEIVSSVTSLVPAPLGIHAHNDADLAVANSLVAVKNGVEMIQGTINGLGERCGNANLCSVLPNLSLKQEFHTIPPEKIKKLFYISRLVSELSNQSPPQYLPFVGNNAFAHKGGIHVSAVRKDARTYEHIEPHRVGNKRIFSISELSGKSNVLEKAREWGIDADDNSASAQEMLGRVKEMELEGYVFEGAEASFELLYKGLAGKREDYFTLDGYRVIVWKNSDDKVWAEATIKAGVPERVSRKQGLEESIEHTSADGSGPVEALDRALRKVLEKFYPELKEVRLTDYKVRILNGGKGTSAVTRVLINSADNHRKWGTVGVSDNIIDASWQALVDSLVYKLMKDQEERGEESERKNQTV